jgi:hypothetical protein
MGSVESEIITKNIDDIPLDELDGSAKTSIHR